jgi:hypothetical protein
MIFNNKKAQVTIFIIIAIVLIFSTALIIYIKNQVVDAEIREFQPIVEDVPYEAQPLRDYVEFCLYQTAEKAIKLAGSQGGWVSVDDPDIIGSNSFVFSDNPTMDDGLSFLSFKIPYWHYVKSPNGCNDCECGSNMPPLKSQHTDGAKRSPSDSSIEAQIDRYIKKKLPSCLANFKTFQDHGQSVVEKSEPVISTVIRPSDVLIYVEYPLVLDLGKSKIDVKEYAVELNVPIFDTYYLAKEVVEKERQLDWLEVMTWSVIDVYSGLTREMPPTHHIDLGGNFKFWLEPEIEEKLKDLLIKHVQLVRVSDVDNFYTSLPKNYDEDDYLSNLQKGFLDGFSYDLNLSKSYPFEMRFHYLGWPMYLDIDPSRGAFVSPSSLTADLYLMKFNMLEYSFGYNVAYPILITIKDPEALNGEGFFFNVADEVNLKNTRPLLCGVGYQESPFGFLDPLFTDPAQFISGDVIIETVDDDGNALEDVIITFRCGDDKAIIGTTKLQTINGEDKALFEGSFPLCQGWLELYKPSYQELTVPFEPKEDEEPTYLIVGLEE